jgi:hypothetical protein
MVLTTPGCLVVCAWCWQLLDCPSLHPPPQQLVTCAAVHHPLLTQPQEAGLQILRHLQRHACYPPPPSQDAAAEGFPVPGSQEWAQLMAATGREAHILPCSLQQPCRVCQKQHITPSELQVGNAKCCSA